MLRISSKSVSRNVVSMRNYSSSSAPRNGSNAPIILAGVCSAAGLASIGVISYKYETDPKFAEIIKLNPILRSTTSFIPPVVELLQSLGALPTKVVPKPTKTVDYNVEVPVVDESSKGAESIEKLDNGENVENVKSVDVEVQEEVALAAATEPTETEVNEAIALLDSAINEYVIEEVPAPAPSIPEPSLESSVAETVVAETPVIVVEALPDLSVLPPVASEGRAKTMNEEILKSALNEQTQQAVALRNEIETALLQDLPTLDEHALRVRVTQLAAELFERTKWEGVRLHQALKQVDGDITRRYSDLLVQQRSELELEMNKRLLEKEQKLHELASKQLHEATLTHERQMASTLNEQAESFTKQANDALKAQAESIRAEFEDQFNHQLALLRKKHADELVQFLGRLEGVSGNVLAFDAVVEDVNKARDFSAHAHKRSAAVLALEAALKTAKPVKKELEALVAVAGGDPLVVAVVDALPSALGSAGAMLLPDLKTRFRVLRTELRQLALAPPNDDLLINSFTGQIIGSVLAAVTFPPKGFVAGDGIEEKLARVEFHLDNGNLKAAMLELDTVPGYGSALSEDWKKLAHDRLVADQAAKILRANAVIMHASLP